MSSSFEAAGENGCNELQPILPAYHNRLRAISERLCAIIVAVLLLKSAVAHIANPYAFLDSVYAYQLTTPSGGLWVAAIVPFVQLVLGFALLLRQWPGTTYALTAALFLGFAIVQTVTVIRGLDIACGCFGTSDATRIGWQTLAVAVAGFITAIVGALLCGKSRKTPCETAYVPH